MTDPNTLTEYDLWATKTVLLDCLQMLGLRNAARKLNTRELNKDIINEHANFIKIVAEIRKHTEVIHMLCFAGLING